MDNNEFSMYYPQLYPTQNNEYFYATYKDNDFVNDETVCMSNVEDKYVDDRTATMEELKSNEESPQEEAYIPPTKNIIRPRILTMPTINKAWQKYIQTNNLHELPQAETIFNTARITRSVKHAISDSGATGHFLVENAPVTNKHPAINQITITLSNGKSIKSTHTCNLDTLWLLHEMTEAHIASGLAHSSFIPATRKFCDAG